MAKASVAFTIKVGSKGKAKIHTQYILREGKYDPDKKSSDKYEDLILTGHGNLPEWAKDNPTLFFEMSDKFERKNGSTYREEVIPLPREFDREQQQKFINEWIEQEIGDKHAYAYAIHEPLASDGKPNPHVHLMKSDRIIDGIERPPEQYFKRYNSKHPERGGSKKANTGLKSSERKTLLYAKRDRFEKMINKHLIELGHSDQVISMKSLKEQGIDRQPINIPMKAYKLIDKIEQKLDDSEYKRDLFVQVVKFDINAELAKFAQRQREKDEQLAQQEAERQLEQERRRLEREQAEREPQKFIEKPSGDFNIFDRYQKQDFSKLYERHNYFIEEVTAGRMIPSDAVKQAKYFYEDATRLEDSINIKTANSSNDIDELNKAHKAIEELTDNFNKFIDKTKLKDNKQVITERSITADAISVTAQAIAQRHSDNDTAEHTAQPTPTNRPKI